MKIILTLTIMSLLVISIKGYFHKTDTKNTERGKTDIFSENVSRHQPLTKEDRAKLMGTTFTIKGEVQFPLLLTVDLLKKMKVISLDSFNVVCQPGAAPCRNIKSSTVFLKDMLPKASIKQLNHQDRNYYTIAQASGEYKATFSLAELFNNPTGKNTYVIFEEKCQPLANRVAKILNFINDIKAGPQRVIWLKSIEVNKVD